VKKLDESYVGFDDSWSPDSGESVSIEGPYPAKRKEAKEEPAREQTIRSARLNRPIRPIDYIDSWDFDFTTGNIIKYVSRHKLKGRPLRDLKKARWYLDRLIETYERR
tara:strand:- start:112 stop:435 length:324 start_codon:yes stop_codon:yes gene_type:complete